MKILRFKIIFITIVYVMSGIVSAKDCGVVGQIYPIQEDDFLQFIMARYQTMQESGEWDKARKSWYEKIIHYAERPSAIHGITSVSVARTYYFDPSIELSRDIRVPSGQIIAKAGTVLNPLSMMTLHKALLFIDADDAKQVAWAIKKDRELQGQIKLVLVKGSVVELAKKLQKPIYFDQQGKLTTHFKIEHVPAIVRQEHLYLKISEVLL